VRRRLYWLLASGVLGAGSRLPLGLGRRLGVVLGLFALRIRPRERRQGEANLTLALPDLTAGQRTRLLRASAGRLGQNLFDTLAADRLLAKSGGVTEEAVQLGEAPLREVLRDLTASGRGLLILTGHLGCWELLGGWLAREVKAAGLGDLGVVTGTIHNPPVDRLVQDRRRRLGMKVLPREGGIRPLLAHLRGGGVAAVLMDQNTRVQNLPVPFFGHPVPTAAGFARLALKLGLPVLPVCLGREAEGHQVRRLPPMNMTGRAVSATEADLTEFLADCNLCLEKMIRRNPAEWVWFHKRWTQP